MTIETTAGTRDWLNQGPFTPNSEGQRGANAQHKVEEPGRYGIRNDRLDEFNKRVVCIKATKISPGKKRKK
jgi:hypothetical protein